MTEMKPICYLDVDDTLLRFPNSEEPPGAAVGAWDLINFLNKHYEVRWLTCWCPCGDMLIERAEMLATLLNYQGYIGSSGRLVLTDTIELESGYKLNKGEDWDEKIELLRSFANPLSFKNDKTDAIDFDRPFIWIEDEILPIESMVLDSRGMLDCWVPCNVSVDPLRVTEVLTMLRSKV
ncbi:MAG: hypothetical protein KOO63_03070 [Bacteroidales bacterium]|nr:hypothetical protein [Candidatus Latescibacterota bacterium]